MGRSKILPRQRLTYLQTASKMSHSHQTTNIHDQEVFHKLTERQAKAWCLPAPMGPEVRRKMASQLARMYPQNGCGVCSPTMKLVAYVSPKGELRMLTAPFRVIPIARIANKPAVNDCPCFRFFDPEVKGPWGSRGEGERARLGGHHPMCQYKLSAQKVFDRMFEEKNGGVVLDDKGVARRQKSRVKVRPDLMIKVMKTVEGS